MYPLKRHRRLRTTSSLRALVKETSLSVDDFITPLFVVEGKGIREEIPSMPGYYRLSLDLLDKEIRELWKLGLKAVLLFVKIPDGLKDNSGKEALNPKGLMQRSIQTVKEACPQMVVMTDVALDPFSSYGHDGIVQQGRIVNDATVEVLCEMSVSHAQAGADIVAPSDMMDGRVLGIRKALDVAGFENTGILSYSAKYASAFYGPFRDALDSAPSESAEAPGDKRTYQMNPANRREAILETASDIEEGADIVMVKPGLCYLDIVRDIRETFDVPIAVYQVSGEYAMLKAAAERGWLDHNTVMMEQLISIKRAGADLIATYFSKEAAELLRD